MWKPGDLICIRFCDTPENQEILGKTLKVVEHSGSISPMWTEVVCDGKRYSVRGSEARKVMEPQGFISVAELEKTLSRRFEISDDPDPQTSISLKQSEWNCLVQCVGEAINKLWNKGQSHHAHGHDLIDVWRKVKQQLR